MIVEVNLWNIISPIRSYCLKYVAKFAGLRRVSRKSLYVHFPRDFVITSRQKCITPDHVKITAEGVMHH